MMELALLNYIGLEFRQVKSQKLSILMGQGIWIDSDKLSADDSIGEIIKHGTLSVGFIGLAETLKNL